MTGTAKALYAFFSQFGVAAYPENSVPDDAELPYITYDLIETDWNSESFINARVWQKSTSYSVINDLLDRISETVGDGIRLPTDKGFIFLAKGDPWIQFQPMDDVWLKVAYLNFVFICATK